MLIELLLYSNCCATALYTMPDTIIITFTQNQWVNPDLLSMFSNISYSYMARSADYSNDNVVSDRKIIAGVGTLLFAILSPLYDLFYRRYIDVNGYMENKYSKQRILYRLFLGLLYQLYIFVGVSASTAIWALNFGEQVYINLLWTMFSLPITYFASVAWLWLAHVSLEGQFVLQRNHMDLSRLERLTVFLTRHYTFLSILRGLCEVFLFASL